MVVGTHKIIAENVYSIMVSKNNIKLNKAAFVYGNLEPDLKIDFVGARHYKSFCYDKIKACIIEMANAQMTLKEFSYRSGVICHYISDMFCYPHNREWIYGRGNTKEHIVFENKQCHLVRNKTFFPNSKIMINEFTSNCIDLFINTLLDEYEKMVDYSRDLVFSVTACYRYLESMLYNYFKKNIVLT